MAIFTFILVGLLCTSSTYAKDPLPQCVCAPTPTPPPVTTTTPAPTTPPTTPPTPPPVTTTTTPPPCAGDYSCSDNNPCIPGVNDDETFEVESEPTQLIRCTGAASPDNGCVVETCAGNQVFDCDNGCADPPCEGDYSCSDSSNPCILSENDGSFFQAPNSNEFIECTGSGPNNGCVVRTCADNEDFDCTEGCVGPTTTTPEPTTTTTPGTTPECPRPCYDGCTERFCTPGSETDGLTFRCCGSKGKYFNCSTEFPETNRGCVKLECTSPAKYNCVTGVCE